MREGFFPKKRYGQNFLVDRSAIKRIVELVIGEAPALLLEVGPGRGEITFPLARALRKVIAIEIDPELVTLLRERALRDQIENLEIIQGDILQVDLSPILMEDSVVVGNLPYYISSAIIERLEHHRDRLRKAVVMVQREVGERLCAAPGGKAYGSLSVLVQYNASVRPLLRLSKTCFWPRPKVDSILLELDYRLFHKKRARDETFFKCLVSKVFRYRRKTILNALLNSSLQISRERCISLLEASLIDPTQRPEEIGIDAFIELSDKLGSS